MQSKIKKEIKEYFKVIDEKATREFIDSRWIEVFKHKINEIINQEHKVNMLELKDYIDIEADKLLKKYHYYNFNGVIFYTKFNSQVEKDLHKLLGWI